MPEEVETDQQKPRVQINFELEGENAALFFAYKQKELITSNANVARKLTVERLRELMPDFAAESKVA